ncbi:hypothetical protein V6N12_011429 [Hibiscus sabdariffa]|uniref:3-dehydroquinate dehydratase n=1 Tax=Hibiscus sabdariffa TaxID=183260 RepID=A0ABR2AW27_9ROSI
MAESVDQMLVQMQKVKEFGGDLVELQVDFLKNFVPRPRWEGGQYDGNENEGQEALHLAVELGADYIDIELKVAHDLFNSLPGETSEHHVRIIVSSHNYERSQSVEELSDLVARIQATGADIVKIATTIIDNARKFFK